MLTVLMAMGMAAAASAAPPAWHDQLHWQDKQATMHASADGGYALQYPGGTRHIAKQALSVDTASPLFDGLFAMAQSDLKKVSVEAIRDPSFDHAQPIDCSCFVAGRKWPFVWTRDLSYATDLGLWRLDPARARRSLRFKLSRVRKAGVKQGLYVMEDTGSGGSWPISTDRVVWFLAARHLLGDKAFAGTVYKALVDTLSQDRLYAFDPLTGLYRGETSFMDWRQQTYPAWTAHNVVFIAQSFALSTNVLHYDALRLAARMAKARHDASAPDYAAQARALKTAINTHFWRADRGMYMSYIGGQIHPAPYEAYDLLGLSLAITSGVADAQRARSTLSHYPIYPAGSPVFWPERANQPIYHNRAIWPFVSAYALKAARKMNAPALIARELRSVMRGAALAGSNMENYDLTTQATHVDDGTFSGPVVDSSGQLWSVAAYMNVVVEGVFGLDGDTVAPKLPVSLVPMLFGSRRSITLHLKDRSITLQLPDALDGNLLVAGAVSRHGRHTRVQLEATRVAAVPLRTDAPMYAPLTPPAPRVSLRGGDWRIASPYKGMLYVNGHRQGALAGSVRVPKQPYTQCFSVTRIGAAGIESLHSPEVCRGPQSSVRGDWPRHWTAPHAGRFQARLSYSNDHGPISSGVTAAVKRLAIRCKGAAPQVMPVVMPQSEGVQMSTAVTFRAPAGARCTFALRQGFNMSFLEQFKHFTGGQGGASGPLNAADIGALHIRPLAGKGAPQ